ncbi:LysR family transcriptional regulator [Patulibacter minatonensis]|uniref:LysR family transcriptional regulator n=1 Tax=Patulibacter minatonensis TaxID=298163 RepID=UPI00047A8954|nr:LysR family transcriptional regulator [Patulibacter minatonensis]
MARLGSVDLNLLLPLAALLEERHVSRAAARAGLSQPAMSRALGRLREALGDELLVRAGGGYALTPRAERLHRELAAVLPRLEELVSDAPFSPHDAAETFRVTGTDYAAELLGPPVFERFFAASPRSQLRFAPVHDGVFDDLERGRTHLIFRAVEGPGRLRSEVLFEDRSVCVVAAGHPLAGRARVGLEEYLACRHIEVSVGDAGEPAVNRRLRVGGDDREIALTVPFFAGALRAAAATDLVATLPRRLVVQQGDRPGVRVLEAPPEVGPLTYRMIWHPRLEDDPPHRWLRDVVRDAAAALDHASEP